MECKACDATKNGGMIHVSLHTCEAAVMWNNMYGISKKFTYSKTKEEDEKLNDILN